MLELDVARSVCFYIICFEIFLSHNAVGEWIDMPQFSDENKIYRISSGKQDHFFKFTQSNRENQRYDNDNMKMHVSINESVNGMELNEEQQFIEDSIITTKKYSEEESTFMTTTEKYDKITVSSIVEEKVSTDEYYNKSINTKSAGILEYLPLDVLRNVHYTLMSQPVSTEGKMLFLKTFEKTLMSEIDSRLALTLSTSREKRGADHYDHGYEDHDDHAVGFPSIEGALMAISFLTFAVYLVRLVMLLFRNMNNVVTTTMGPTMFLGRRKRSINEFDDAIKILNSVDGFVYNF